jgi:single-strand DNA-binding protein
MNINSVVISARLTKDPQLEKTRNGKDILRFSVANNYYGGENNKNAVNFFNCTAWGKTAVAIANYMKKGSHVLLRGELRQHTWQAKDGTSRQSVEIVVQEVEFLGGKNEGAGNQAPAQSAPDASGAQGYNDDEVQF